MDQAKLTDKQIELIADGYDGSCITYDETRQYIHRIAKRIYHIELEEPMLSFYAGMMVGIYYQKNDRAVWI